MYIVLYFIHTVTLFVGRELFFVNKSLSTLKWSQTMISVYQYTTVLSPCQTAKLCLFNSIPKDKILHFSKLEALADNKMDVAQEIIIFLQD